MTEPRHQDHHRQRTTAPPDSGPAGPPPGGVLWDFSGELRALMSLPAALAMQVAHPAVGAGVDEHSVFRTDPWGRAERSVRSVLLWVYGGPEGAAEGRRLRRLHRDIRGTDTAGRRYHALDPALYGWVHATGFPVMVRARSLLYERPYTAEEEGRLYTEWRQVGLVLGLREADLPPTAAGFEPEYRAWLNDLEATPVLRELTDPRRRIPPPDRGPVLVRLPLRAVWPVVRRPLARAQSFLTTGLMPADARAAIGLEWTERQERRLRRLGRCTARVVPRLPERLRYLPYAARARRASRVPSPPAAAGDRARV
ncbi:oxygenase MpaB family protein [Streptomyces otsuchiensis]|uniref:oxygenase MpaB family protein n=1 Tax=Streptomyces otsuchiensis TaxID=2681388 RepID=UPI0010307CB9|nr:oxygenase MpaB family protein [Streptomyces otsuchiensis]